MEAPHLSSPTRALPPLPMAMSPSRSAPDMNATVGNLISRFNTLKVADSEEEKTQKQLRRLESALRRAEMAREEAETEVKSLRKELKVYNEVGEDWLAEKQRLKGGLNEYEKKYERAKAHFRAQKTKHEEQTRKAAKEFMEREKAHWRNQAAAEEEIEWERRLRGEAMELVAFMEIERQIAVRCERQARSAAQRREKSERETSRADSAVDQRIVHDRHHHEEQERRALSHPARDAEAMDARYVQERESDAQQEGHRNTPAEQNGETVTAEHLVSPPAQEDNEDMSFEQGHEETSKQEEQPGSAAPDTNMTQSPNSYPAVFDDASPEPESAPAVLSPPKKKTLTVPINFGDEEEEEDDYENDQDENTRPVSVGSDKENSAPQNPTFSTPARSISALCQRTPATIASSHPSLHSRSRSDARPATTTTPAPAHPPTEWGRNESEWNIPGVLAHADLDKAAALAMIRERRGRARSFVNSASASGNERSKSRSEGENRSVSRTGATGVLATPARKTTGAVGTPKTVAGMGRRDVSAPAGYGGLGTMSVGRKARQ